MTRKQTLTILENDLDIIRPPALVTGLGTLNTAWKHMVFRVFGQMEQLMKKIISFLVQKENSRTLPRRMANKNIQ